MISNRRGSSVSNDENEREMDGENDIIAWDFDTSSSDAMIANLPDEKEGSAFPSRDYARSLSSPKDGLPTISTVPSQLSSNVSQSTALEHPLEQLFSDETIRSATAPPGLRSRKDTLPSRPVSPLPPLLSTTPLSASETDYRPGTALSMTSYDLRLPDIPTSGPIQIEIPATEETLRKDQPGVRSRSATVTRTARSDSTGSAGFPARMPRYNPAEPMPQPHSPPTSSRAASPKPQLPLPSSFPVQGPLTTNISKVQPPPTSPPKLNTTQPPIPPGSPPKGHISSKSAPNSSSVANGVIMGVGSSYDPGIAKTRSSDGKTSRPPNLTLNVLIPIYSR